MGHDPVRELDRLLDRIERLREQLMADFTALNAATTALAASVDQAVTALEAGAGNAADQTSVDAATAAVNAANDKLVAGLPAAPAAPAVLADPAAATS